jgi:hypothetical protein
LEFQADVLPQVRDIKEGVIIHIGRDNGESLVEILQQPCENFRCNIEARGLKAFRSDSNV